jgi:hypothetical protein
VRVGGLTKDLKQSRIRNEEKSKIKIKIEKSLKKNIFALKIDKNLTHFSLAQGI